MQENAMGPFERRRSKITRRQLSEPLTAWFWEGWISTFVEQVHKWALLSFFQGSRSVQIISASTLPSMLLTSTMWLSGEVWIRAAHSSQVDFCLIIPFTPESDQSQISPPAPPEILHHTVRRTSHLCIFSLKGWENGPFELRSERVISILSSNPLHPLPPTPFPPLCLARALPYPHLFLLISSYFPSLHPSPAFMSL